MHSQHQPLEQHVQAHLAPMIQHASRYTQAKPQHPTASPQPPNSQQSGNYAGTSFTFGWIAIINEEPTPVEAPIPRHVWQGLDAHHTSTTQAIPTPPSPRPPHHHHRRQPLNSLHTRTLPCHAHQRLARGHHHHIILKHRVPSS